MFIIMKIIRVLIIFSMIPTNFFFCCCLGKFYVKIGHGWMGRKTLHGAQQVTDWFRFGSSTQVRRALVTDLNTYFLPGICCFCILLVLNFLHLIRGRPINCTVFTILTR